MAENFIREVFFGKTNGNTQKNVTCSNCMFCGKSLKVTIDGKEYITWQCKSLKIRLPKRPYIPPTEFYCVYWKEKDDGKRMDN